MADDGTIEVKLHSKNEAVNMLLRSIGAIIEKNEFAVTPGLAELLVAARRRVEKLRYKDRMALAPAFETIAEPSNKGLEAFPASRGDCPHN